MEKTIKLYMDSESKMMAFGHALAKAIKLGDILALEGDLGTGKTTLSKAIGAGLGITDLMRSPTFAIANEYALNDGKLIHADVYRLADEDELYAIGFEDYFTDNNIVMIEWANLITDFLSDELTATLWLKLYYQDEGRRVEITADENVLEQLENIYDFGN